MNLNESVDALVISQQTSGQFNNAVNLIGKDVVYEGSEFEFTGEAVEIGYELDEAATSVSIIIQDKNGATVTTLNSSELDAGNGESFSTTPLIRSEVTGVELDPEADTTNIVTLAGSVNLTSMSAAYDNAASIVTSAKLTDIMGNSSGKFSELESEISRSSVSSDVLKITDSNNEQIAQDSLKYYLTT